MKNQTTCSDIQYRRVKPQGGRRENKRMEAKGAKTSVGLHTSKFAAGVRALFCSPLSVPSALGSECAIYSSVAQALSPHVSSLLCH